MLRYPLEWAGLRERAKCPFQARQHVDALHVCRGEGMGQLCSIDVSPFIDSPPVLNRVASGALTGKGKTAAVQAEEGRGMVKGERGGSMMRGVAY